jgi:AraC-like DNA-binding protein
MGYHVIKPPEHLAEYIRFFWVLESDVPYQHHAVADGHAEMIFHYSGTFTEVIHGREESSWISGVQAQSQRSRTFQTGTGFGIFGVYLYPYMLSTLFNIPAHVLSNEMPDLQTLLGSEGRELEEKIMLVDNHQARVKILSEFIEKKIIQRNSPLDKMSIAIRHTLERDGQVSVQHMANDFGLSVRQFERSFKKYSGFSPKLYTRIVRFSNAVKTYRTKDVSLTTIAYACGYYDQAHFNEDFKTFAGVTPTKYFQSIQIDS